VCEDTREIDDALLTRVLEGIREIVLRKLHSSQPYVGLVCEFCDDPHFLFEFAREAQTPEIADRVVESIIERCKSSAFAAALLAGADRNRARLMSAKETPAQALSAKFIAAAIKGADAATATAFVDALFAESLQNSERFSIERVYAPDAFLPFQVYLEAFWLFDQAKFVSGFLIVLSNVMKNPIWKSFNLSSLFQILAILANRDSSWGDRIAAFFTAELTTQCVEMVGFARLLSFLASHRQIKMDILIKTAQNSDKPAVVAENFIAFSRIVRKSRHLWRPSQAGHPRSS
jgi:hypothetical protein